MTIDSSGNVLVGTTSTSLYNDTSGGGINLFATGGATFAKQSTSASDPVLLLNNTGDAGQILDFRKDGTTVGSISVTASATAYNTSSDYRLKDITGSLQGSGDYIDSLNPVEGTWLADGSVFVGLIAHEADEVSRTKIATGEKDGEEMQGMSYSSPEMIANLISEVQALRKRVSQLEG